MRKNFKGMYFILDGLVMLAFLLLDQFTKHLAIVHLKGQSAM